jgi:hypothetical protein
MARESADGLFDPVGNKQKRKTDYHQNNSGNQ